MNIHKLDMILLSKFTHLFGYIVTYLGIYLLLLCWRRTGIEDGNCSRRYGQTTDADGLIIHQGN